MTTTRSERCSTTAEIVGDEQVGHAEVALQLHQEVEHLGLHALVQGGDGLVAHDELRVGGEGPGDGHPLQLPAGELVRVRGRA